MRIGIAGYGFVGQAVHSCVREDVEVVIHDPPKGMDALITEEQRREEIREVVMNPTYHGESVPGIEACDVVFVCLPTPSKDNGKVDHSCVSDFLKELEDHKFKGVAAIKSTGMWHKLSWKPSFGVVYNPEFLNANTFAQDFAAQEVIFLGGRMDHCRIAARCYKECFELFDQMEFVYCSITDAVALKYSHNVKHALNVLFWNWVQETWGNQRLIASMYNQVPGAPNDMQRICADGMPGYGGACLPKDVKAAHGAYPHELTDAMIVMNQRLRDNGFFKLSGWANKIPPKWTDVDIEKARRETGEYVQGAINKRLDVRVRREKGDIHRTTCPNRMELKPLAEKDEELRKHALADQAKVKPSRPEGRVIKESDLAKVGQELLREHNSNPENDQ